MANAEHVKMLVTSTAEEWNQWREEHPNEIPDLSGVELAKKALLQSRGGGSADLSLSGRNLRDASLASTDFRWVEIGTADFTSADLECAWFAGALFHAGPATGLDDVLSNRPEYPSCDKFCRTRYRDIKFAYPKDCARRCGDELSHDQEHVARLLEGVKAWNEWRDRAPDIRPDLSGLDVHGLFEKEWDIDERDELDLSGINFKDAILRGTKFFKVKLNQSTCYGSDLRCSVWRGVEAGGINFVGSDLRNATMSLVDLSGSNLGSARTSGLKFDVVQLARVVLRQVDLRGMKFWFSDLSHADLTEAHICGSMFDEANLTGANLNGTRIWRAKLFNSEHTVRTPAVDSVDEREIENIPAYLHELFRIHVLASGEPNSNGSDLVPSVPSGLSYEVYYRGHGSDRWCLSPTVN